MSRIVIAAYDTPLRSEIERGLMPHFASDEAVLHMQARPIVEGQMELCGLLDEAALLVIGFTGVGECDYWAIESARRAKRPCGLILKTEDRSKIASLSVMHRSEPFRFLIVVGSLRQAVLQDLFPRTQIVSDLSSLVEPGKQIVSFMRRQCA